MVEVLIMPLNDIINIYKNLDHDNIIPGGLAAEIKPFLTEEVLSELAILSSEYHQNKTINEELVNRINTTCNCMNFDDDHTNKDIIKIILEVYYNHYVLQELMEGYSDIETSLITMIYFYIYH